MSRQSEALAWGRKSELKHGYATRSPIKRRGRSVEDFARVYGSKERVRWVKNLPCIFCGAQTGMCQNAHIRNGGLSRKADACFIVPACFTCHRRMDSGIGKRAIAAEYELDLEAEAIRIEAEWQGVILW